MRVAIHSTAQHYMRYLQPIGELFDDYVIITRHDYEGVRGLSPAEAQNAVAGCDFVITCGLNHKGSKYCPENLAKLTRLGLCFFIGHSTLPPESFIQQSLSANKGSINLFPDYMQELVEFPENSMTYKGHYMYLAQEKSLSMPYINNGMSVNRLLYIPHYEFDSKSQFYDHMDALAGYNIVIRPHPGTYIKNGHKGRPPIGFTFSDYQNMTKDMRTVKVDASRDVFCEFDEAEAIVATYKSSLVNEFIYRKLHRKLTPIHSTGGQVQLTTDYNQEQFADFKQIKETFKKQIMEAIYANCI